MMKKIVIILFILALAVPLCYAKGLPKSTIGMNLSKGPTYKNIIAEIKSVTVGDPAKGTKSEIVIVEKTETEPKEYTLQVTPETTIQDVGWESINLKELVPGDKVKVKCRVMGNDQMGTEQYELVSIKVTKK